MHEDLATQRSLARRWLGLAVGSLVLAGLFALLLVVARMPPFSDAITDALFFRRCLVVHVVLALCVWFYAFAGALYALLPARGGAGPLARLGPYIGLAGVTVLMLAAGAPGAEPVLANYVPMIDHPLFAGGLALFGVGVACTLLDGRLLPSRELAAGVFPVPSAARPLLRATALAFVLALLTFGAAAGVTPRYLEPQPYYELVAWGGGHVLQFASVAAMLAVWLILVDRAVNPTGAAIRPVMSRRLATGLAAVLVLPLLAAPILAGQGTVTGLYRLVFTRLMELGIFPVVLVVLFLCLRTLRRARREGAWPARGWRDPALCGFAASATLAVIGFVLGALIHGSNTLVPAHYHAAIGAVTVAFMAVTWPLLDALGIPLPGGRLRRAIAWQPLAFGAGQTVFALGFALAGAHGMGRKLYGQEQTARTVAETVGLSVMGLGGLIAIAAGLLFIGIVAAAWARGALRRPIHHTVPTTRGGTP